MRRWVGIADWAARRFVIAIALLLVLSGCDVLLGGRFVEEPPPSAPMPTDGISRDAAIDTARDAVSAGAGWRVLLAMAGPIGEVMPGYAGSEFEERLPANLWIWREFLERGDRGVEVWIDYLDGVVYGTAEVILN